MTTVYDFRRLRPWEYALAAFAVAAPFILPAVSPQAPSFIRAAVAQEMQRPDTARLVSVGGAITEIIYALGEEKRLVARDSTSLYPAEATRLPDVGYMRQLSPEGVIATNPSAVIAIEGSGPPEALAVLQNAKIAFRTVPETYDRDGILTKIRTVGDFLGVPEKADTLAKKVEAELDAAAADAARRPQADRKRVLFILSTQGGKIMASGSGTAANGIIDLSGAVNAAGTFPGYKPLTDEAIIEARPDVILMMTRGGDHGASDADLLAHPALSLTPAAKDKRIIRMDGLYLLGFGPRTADAIHDLNVDIYGKKANVSQ